MPAEVPYRTGENAGLHISKKHKAMAPLGVTSTRSKWGNRGTKARKLERNQTKENENVIPVLTVKEGELFGILVGRVVMETTVVLVAETFAVVNVPGAFSVVVAVPEKETFYHINQREKDNNKVPASASVEFCKGARQSGLVSVWRHTLVGQWWQGFL